ncbi:hypothetical protein [Amycolatopsis solani]|uniref:hypothetical protein n=1 Tax=Amycolatopsis solani TaxID=3028615 RepID=UPI0025B024EE|nr:hypothetical protein [Amycolatopsis sp. MEP2-6]
MHENDEDTFESDWDEAFDELESDDEGLYDDEAAPSAQFRGGFAPLRRSPLGRVTTPTGSGVSAAVLATPQGQARMQLSQSVVSKTDFDSTITALRNGLNRNTDRLNTVQRDVAGLSSRVTAVFNADQRQRRELAKLRAQTTKWQKANTTAITKARRESQNTTMLFVLLTVLGQSSSGTTNNNALILLPLLLLGGLGGDGGGSGGGDANNNMMTMLILVLVLTGSLGTKTA